MKATKLGYAYSKLFQGFPIKTLKTAFSCLMRYTT